MSERNFDLDYRLSRLESEWRNACEFSRAADAEFAALSACNAVAFADLHSARARLDQAEQLKHQIMAKIERLDLAVRRNCGLR